MPLFELTNEQVKIVVNIMRNFPLQGNKELCKQYIIETDKIEKSLSNPIDPNYKENGNI